MASQQGLNSRAQILLKSLVELYVAEGQPVASRALVSHSGLSISPATVRNVLADLEALGLVHSPHTSAGRIPTVSGYRLFVDQLVTVQPFDDSALESLKHRFGETTLKEDLSKRASSLLSEMTNMVSVVTLPKVEEENLHHIEFLKLAQNRVLVILVTQEQSVQNRVIHTAKQFTESELKVIANYLNDTFHGTPLALIPERLAQLITEEKDQFRLLLQKASDMTDTVFGSPKGSGDYVVSGESNIVDIAKEVGVEKLRQLFEAISQKQEILHLLDQCIAAEATQIFIGQESGYEILEDCSIVAAPYGKDGRIVGVLSVIGPTRMAYDRVISAVDITAKLMGLVLTHEQESQ